MGLIDRLAGGTAYLDANVFIYAIERVPELFSLVADYMAAIQPQQSLQVVPVSREILVAAARRRTASRLKLPDAIHAATAVQSGCSHLVTNDARFRVVSEVEVIVLGELL